MDVHSSNKTQGGGDMFGGEPPEKKLKGSSFAEHMASLEEDDPIRSVQPPATPSVPGSGAQSSGDQDFAKQMTEMMRAMQTQQQAMTCCMTSMTEMFQW
jgi:hypothetical protein